MAYWLCYGISDAMGRTMVNDKPYMLWTWVNYCYLAE